MEIEEARLYTFLRMFIVDGTEFYIINPLNEEEGDYLIKQLDEKPRVKDYRIISDNPNLSRNFRKVLLNPKNYFLLTSTYIYHK